MAATIIMTDINKNKTCAVIGASHAGVNFAFALRREGWEGNIILFDADPMLPYHRPPLSKAYLTSDDGMEKNILKSAEAYEKENIELCLGIKVTDINRPEKIISLNNGNTQKYDKLILATGARPFIPPIPGIEKGINIFPMRTAEDATNIRHIFQKIKNKKVVVIGGGYIGLETAASLKKLGGDVTVLEREERVLARVTAPVLSDYFQKLHAEKGVHISTKKNVVKIENKEDHNLVFCEDGAQYTADMIIVGVGIKVNMELAEKAGLEIENGIKVDATACTNDPDIYAIGDCTFHHNPYYDRYVRLESVQNAVDQAKVAAAALCGKEVKYDAVPWFWSDQYDVKLQMVGLSDGHDNLIIREEKEKKNCFSVWYFKGKNLLAVDAVNYAKAYVLGTRFIKNRQKIDKAKLANADTPFKPAELMLMP